MTDVRSVVLGVLTDNPRKPPRVLAKLIADQLHHQPPAGEPVVVEERPDPATWTDYESRLIDDGIATTRNRTDAALRSLGLEPAEIRAVVIERDWLRIYRWTDTATAQTMPILKETA